MSETLRHHLERYELGERYPVILAARYPRIVEHILELWGSPKLSAYFEELLIMDRPERQGFPPEVGAELMSLAFAYDHVVMPQQAEVDVWSHVHEKAQEELVQRGLDATPRDFHQSVSRGDQGAIGLFLRAGLPVDARDEQEWTPLIRSAFEGNLPMLEALLKAGAAIHAHDADGYGVLHWAALKGHEAVVEFLLQHGARVDATSKHGFTPLIQAASQGHAKLIRRLIAAGAQINATTFDGWTALHKAVANDHIDACVALLDHGADPLAAYQDGTTPVTIALQTNRPRLYELLNMAARLRQRRPEAYNYVPQSPLIKKD
ncbi:ankyrin repeat domain-containing protein [Chitinolyticbacter albus]|uniref:ankyrin repeat domain-containing protein n=1 Tax=Chitinolyticbacter albus TaxID=2961951 RepID=UPI00210A2A2D|nr:ankyrin repeat domain-containing protein [Chitinolyticbacter albus]